MLSEREQRQQEELSSVPALACFSAAPVTAVRSSWLALGVPGLAAVTLNPEHVKRLLNGKRKQWPAGWSCLPKGSMPIGAEEIPDGDTIDRLRVRVPGSSNELPDYEKMYESLFIGASCCLTQCTFVYSCYMFLKLAHGLWGMLGG